MSYYYQKYQKYFHRLVGAGVNNNQEIPRLINRLQQLQDDPVCEPRWQPGQEGTVANTIYHRAEMAIQWLQQYQPTPDNQIELQRIRIFAHQTPAQIETAVASELFDPPEYVSDSNSE